MEDNMKTAPTDAQVKVLMSDWLGSKREEGTYVNKNTKGAIRRTLSKNESYSDYFTGGLDIKDPLDQIRVARSIAQGIVSSMTDERVEVRVGGHDSYTTIGGDKVNVATSHFDDKSLTLGEKIDILTGFAVHEACHVNHSDFTALDRLKSVKDGTAKLRKTIMNILEDERIELLLGESPENGGDGMPGLADFIACAKKRVFGSYEDEKKKKGVKTTQKLPEFIDTMICAVRFPSSLTEDKVRKNFDELDKVRRILTPFPSSPSAIEKATDSIVEVLRDMVAKDMQQQQNQQQSSQTMQQEQDSQQGGGQGGGQNGGQDPQQKGGQNQASGSDGKEQKKPTKSEINEMMKQALSTDEMEKLLQAISETLDKPKAKEREGNAAVLENNSAAATEYANGEGEKGTGAGGTNEISYVRKATGDRNRYDQSLARVKRYIPAMSKALRCKTMDRDYELMGMKSGKLNTNKLVNLKMGNTTIFSKKGTVTTDSACICLLIDESGSMKHERASAARDAAVLINEAVRHIPNLELFVYGFTNDELNIYCERRHVDRWALGSTKADGGTPTAGAMNEAAARIRKMTRNTCLMVVITDGMPNNAQATRDADARLTREGFLPVGVDITGSESVKKIFREAIVTNNIQELATFMGRLVKNKLNRTLKTHDL